jgi:hypothetical protein
MRNIFDIAWITFVKVLCVLLTRLWSLLTLYLEESPDGMRRGVAETTTNYLSGPRTIARATLKASWMATTITERESTQT